METGDVPSCFPSMSGMHPGLRPSVDGVEVNRVWSSPPAETAMFVDETRSKLSFYRHAGAMQH